MIAPSTAITLSSIVVTLALAFAPAADEPPCLNKAHNAERVSRELPAMEVNAALQAAAQSHAENMAAMRSLTHAGLSKRVLAVAYKWQAVAENIASGQDTVAEVMQSWMGSRGHRSNILGPYKHFGTGVARAANGTLYWCVICASPSNGSP